MPRPGGSVIFEGKEMGKRHYGGSASVNANTETIGPFDVRGERLALVAAVGDGAPVDIMVQGSIKGVSEIEWVDTALGITAANNQTGQITPGGDGTVFAVFNIYRIQISSAGENNVVAQLIELD